MQGEPRRRTSGREAHAPKQIGRIGKVTFRIKDALGKTQLTII